MMGGSSVDSGDAVTSPPAKGEVPAGSEASAAASLAGLSAIGLGVIPLPLPAADISNCLIDPGLDEPLIEAESESRSRSEGLGEAARIPGMLNAVEERRMTVPTLFHRDFLEGDTEIEPGGVVDMVEIDSKGCQISGKNIKSDKCMMDAKENRQQAWSTGKDVILSILLPGGFVEVRRHAAYASMTK
jgi:hypothetical protein